MQSMPAVAPIWSQSMHQQPPPPLPTSIPTRVIMSAKRKHPSPPQPNPNSFDSNGNLIQSMNPILADILTGKLDAVLQQHRASAAASVPFHPQLPQQQQSLIRPFIINSQQLLASSLINSVSANPQTNAKPFPIKPIPIRLVPPPVHCPPALNQSYFRPDERTLLREKLKRKFETIEEEEEQAEDLSIAASQRQPVDQLDFNPNSPFKPVQGGFGAFMAPSLPEMEKLKLGHVIDRIFMNAFTESHWPTAGQS